MTTIHSMSPELKFAAISKKKCGPKAIYPWTTCPVGGSFQAANCTFESARQLCYRYSKNGKKFFAFEHAPDAAGRRVIEIGRIA